MPENYHVMQVDFLDKTKEPLKNLLCGRIASLLRAHNLAYRLDMSLRAVRLALHPARGVFQRFPNPSIEGTRRKRRAPHLER